MSGHLIRGLVISAALVLVAACGGGTGDAGGAPDAVVRSALSAAQSKDFTALEGLACEAQKDEIRDQFDFSAALSGLAPGIDSEQILDAIAIDTSNVEVGDPTINGDKATVEVSGSMSIDVDVDKLKPIIKAALEAQGLPSDDATIDQAMGLFGAMSSQDIPMDETLALVKEGGAWKICE
ncbi:MAG: hypothetical protein A2V85_02010 [Chloroflexi bacterium RBG_16_72_14]|nr:MAG: hypothetical protein A2V85_02010 [Chloroflexi bacterium RBG_16_72_14]